MFVRQGSTLRACLLQFATSTGGPFMAFEGVTCPECGAKEGITKVEPDTYYCSHHKGLFKYVDPSRHEREFCSCGNRVNFQCRVCGTGLCRKCDIAQLVKQPEGSSRFDKEAVDSWRDN